MMFNSFEFPLFLIIVTILTYSIPRKYRWLFFLVISFLFYGYINPYFLLPLIGSCLLDYFLALKLSKAKPGNRKKILVAGVLHNVLLLLVFKYLLFFTQFFNVSVGELIPGLRLPLIHILLPIGISYYTFKKISYLIDLYREKIKPETHLGQFMLYSVFFPSVLAGPIDRAGDLLPQFKHPPAFDYDRMVSGSVQVLWGLFKKMLIADNLANTVNTVFNQPERFQSHELFLAVIFFTIQIYCDFSGYSDIAIGTGRILGIRLADNFNRPYHAVSITDFWNRWHISLSTWLRDYLFLPISYRVSDKIKKPVLLGLRADKWAYILGVVSTMLICGIWHGAAWTFVFWGGIHGVYMAVAFATRKTRSKFRKKLHIKKNSRLHKVFGVTVTFTFVSLSWTFFKAKNLDDAFYIVSRVFSGFVDFFIKAFEFFSKLESETLGRFLLSNRLKAYNIHLMVVMLAFIFIWAWEIYQGKRTNISETIGAKPVWLRWPVYYFMIFAILIFGHFGTQQFIYFQF